MAAMRRALIVLLPGLATAPGFMDAIGAEMAARLEEHGFQTETESVYAYGDWSRSVILQTAEIGYDLALPPTRYGRSIGAARLRSRLSELVCGRLAGAEGPLEVLMLCHSGGGMAGMHGARWLRHQKGELVRVRTVLIGTPKCRVRAEERQDVLAITFSPRPRRFIAGDPVRLFGVWGGWERPSGIRMRWNRDKHAPAVQLEIPIVGGHPDYFRGHLPYADEAGMTNLQKTAGGIEQWLIHQWDRERG
ncbi:hypothetical protein WMW72_19730 [Paenibacillus filicis]|uniref:Alpha/beta hydrolase n=1 Tax=Paenibacillus filicis TaxID=669464 RepID=A0ABU9DQV0_9BACL